MKKERTKIVSGRIPLELKKQMTDYGLSVKDAIEMSIHIKLNPKIEFIAELKKLIFENEQMSNKIVHNNQRIEELKEKIGYAEDNNKLKNDLFKSDNEKAIQRTLTRYITWKGQSNAKIHNFIESKVGKEYIEMQLELCNLTEEEFLLELIDKCDNSEQTQFN